MEDMFNLNRHIMQIVDRQIAENDPPAAKETYDRLIRNGDDDATAKEKIAAAIAEEIYLMLVKESTIDINKYAERLSNIE